MDNSQLLGRFGDLTVTSGRALHAAVRMLVAVVVSTLLVAVMSAPSSVVSPAVRLTASANCIGTPDVTCALIMGGTSVPTPDAYYIDTVISQYIAPTHPGQIQYVAVTTPEEMWPLTALLFRVPGLAVGSPDIWGPGGAGWPDEPWWKLSGLFDRTFDQSLRAGVADLEEAMANQPNDRLVIYGYSQGAMVANAEKRKLAEQYPEGTKAPDIDFVLSGDPNLPNGGFASRFPGLYLPIVDVSFNGSAPTDTQFDTVEITRQYEGVADFPLYPLNVLADLNAVLGVFYVHLNDFDVRLPAQPRKSPAYQGTYGDTDYYFFETKDLPLFDPLRSLGVPEPLIDVVEPVARWAVELGYDRSIKPWEPTPARLIPMHDPAKVAGDLVKAIGESINNALALFGVSPLPDVTTPDVDTMKSDIAGQVRIPQDSAEFDRAVIRDEARETGWKAGRGDSDEVGWKRGARVRPGHQKHILQDSAELDRAVVRDEAGETGWKAKEDDSDEVGWKRGLRVWPGHKAVSDAELDRAVVRDEARETGWKAKEDDSDEVGWKRGPRLRPGHKAGSDEGGRDGQIGRRSGPRTGPGEDAGHADQNAEPTSGRANRTAQAADAHAS